MPCTPSAPTPLLAQAHEPTPISIPSLPIDVAQIIHFVLFDSFAQSLLNSASNTFFSPRAGKVEIREGTGGCWELLPEQWKDYFEGLERIDVEQRFRDQVWADLAAGKHRPDWPPSLNEFLKTCIDLSLDRTCSPVPVLAWPEREHKPATSTETMTHAAPWHPATGKSNAMRAGQSPKKMHEVEQCSTIVADLLETATSSSDPRPTHAIDIGSGRAHLSRALAEPPLDLHVLAVDYSETQTSGADYLTTIKVKIQQRTVAKSNQVSPEGYPLNEEENTVAGSLTTRTTDALDAQGIVELLRSWPPPPVTTPALMAALHACGDLTVSCIRAYLATHPHTPTHRRAVLVGCCYNLLTPSASFPLSVLVASQASIPGQTQEKSTTSSKVELLSASLTRNHLRLTPQSPPTWDTRSTSPGEIRTSVRKLLLRARLAAELEACPTIGPVDEALARGESPRRIGRVPVTGVDASWEMYRERALRRFHAAGRGDNVNHVTIADVNKESSLSMNDEVPRLEMSDEEMRVAQWRLGVWWTLRSHLGPVVETLLVVDRWAGLVEGLCAQGDTRTRVELVNLFDQKSSGSLRNLALVVR